MKIIDEHNESRPDWVSVFSVEQIEGNLKRTAPHSLHREGQEDEPCLRDNIAE